jgi:hypothetical protein
MKAQKIIPGSLVRDHENRRQVVTHVKALRNGGAILTYAAGFSQPWAARDVERITQSQLEALHIAGLGNLRIDAGPPYGYYDVHGRAYSRRTREPEIRTVDRLRDLGLVAVGPRVRFSREVTATELGRQMLTFFLPEDVNVFATAGTVGRLIPSDVHAPTGLDVASTPAVVHPGHVRTVIRCLGVQVSAKDRICAALRDQLPGITESGQGPGIIWVYWKPERVRSDGQPE